MRRAVVWLVAACNFTPGNAPTDGRAIDAGSDASIDARVWLDAPGSGSGSAVPDCNQDWHDGTITFGAPVAIAELDTPATERDPFLSPDELTIYYALTPLAGSGAIMTATRPSIAGKFGSPSPFAATASTDGESKMSISTDQLSLVVCLGDGSGNYAYMATRTSELDAWPSLSKTNLDDIDGSGYTNTYDPELGSDGTFMIYAPTTTSGGQHLELATRANVSSEFAVTDITGYDNSETTYDDADPWIDRAHSVIAFSRVAVGFGNVMIYYMVAQTGSFGAPVLVPGVSTTDGTATADAWVSPDGCRIYLSSNRSGNYDLYMATAQ